MINVEKGKDENEDDKGRKDWNLKSFSSKSRVPGKSYYFRTLDCFIEIYCFHDLGPNNRCKIGG